MRLTSVTHLQCVAAREPVRASKLHPISLVAHPAAHQLAGIRVTVEIMNVEIEEAGEEAAGDYRSFRPQVQLVKIGQLGKVEARGPRAVSRVPDRPRGYLRRSMAQQL
jgi:hypothetical protein